MSNNRHLTQTNYVFRIQISIALLILMLDQATKLTILSYLEPNSTVEITSFFNLVLVYNKGAAFGFLATADFDANQFFLIANLLILCVLVYALWVLRPGRNQSATAIWLIIGGAVGNILDRIMHGHVVDFLDFHYAGWHYSAFNVADSAITIGAILIAMEILGIRLLFRDNKTSKSNDSG